MMVLNTEVEMKKRQLQRLEQELVAKAREITEVAQSASFSIPYTQGESIRYVIVGSGAAAQGLVTMLRAREKREKK